MAMEEWALRMRVSFCKAGIQGTWTAAAKMRSGNAATCSTREKRRGVIV
jgi:hypothetical protein